jgi:hypothetical protein
MANERIHEAYIEGHGCAGNKRGVGSLKERIDTYRAGEPVGWPLLWTLANQLP